MNSSLLDHWVISRRAFFPRRQAIPSPFTVDAGDARLACAFVPPAAGAPTLIHFHGNGEIVADYLGDFQERIARLGCGLLLAEYRGYGMSTGEPQLGRMLDDVGAIVRATGAPPERLVLFGRSIGSLFAIEGAFRFPQVAALILESAIADPLQFILQRVQPAELDTTHEDLAAAVAERLDHRKKLAAYPGPVLVLHALFDDLVDATNADRLISWATGPVTSRLFDRGNHNTILADNEAAYFEAIGSLLAGPPP